MNTEDEHRYLTVEEILLFEESLEKHSELAKNMFDCLKSKEELEIKKKEHSEDIIRKLFKNRKNKILSYSLFTNFYSQMEDFLSELLNNDGFRDFSNKYNKKLKNDKNFKKYAKEQYGCEKINTGFENQIIYFNYLKFTSINFSKELYKLINEYRVIRNRIVHCAGNSGIYTDDKEFIYIKFSIFEKCFSFDESFLIDLFNEAWDMINEFRSDNSHLINIDMYNGLTFLNS